MARAEDEGRQTQLERSAQTRAKLLDATYSILRDLGHLGLRSANIASTAQVSRGGLLHHYPSKEDLIAAVFERIVEDMDENSRQRSEAASDNALLPAIVADAEARFFHDSYRVMLDILIASGQQPPVLAVRKALADREGPKPCDRWAARLIATGVDPDTARQVTTFLWNLTKGLAVRSLVRRDEAHIRKVTALGLALAASRCNAQEAPAGL